MTGLIFVVFEDITTRIYDQLFARQSTDVCVTFSREFQHECEERGAPSAPGSGGL